MIFACLCYGLSLQAFLIPNNIVGGGISGEGDYLLDMVVPLVRAEVYGQGIVRGTDIRIASLRNDAGIIGGAVLGLK